MPDSTAASPPAAAADAVIVGAGRGLRMHSAVPKQYLLLDGKPVLAHTLQAFDACDSIRRIHLVVPAADIHRCRRDILAAISFQKPILLTAGGRRRQDSVRNGIRSIRRPPRAVVVHDGVRPFVRPDQISACVAAALEDGACILGLPVADTLKTVGPGGIVDKTVDRRRIWTAQTPQAFVWPVIWEAHEAAARDGYEGTDDASLVERLGKKVRVIGGSRMNIKITTTEDLWMARALTARLSRQVRSGGTGQDDGGAAG